MSHCSRVLEWRRASEPCSLRKVHWSFGTGGTSTVFLPNISTGSLSSQVLQKHSSNILNSACNARQRSRLEIFPIMKCLGHRKHFSFHSSWWDPHMASYILNSACNARHRSGLEIFPIIKGLGHRKHFSFHSSWWDPHMASYTNGVAIHEKFMLWGEVWDGRCLLR